MTTLNFRALAVSLLVLGMHIKVSVALPVRPNLVADVGLNEQGYQQIAALKNDNIMKDFIRRIVTKLGYRVADEGELSGFTTYFSGTNAVQDYQTLEKELVDVPWLQKEEVASLASEWEHSIDELAAAHAKEEAAREAAAKAAAAARAREEAAKAEAATVKAQAIVARAKAKSPKAAPASAAPGSKRLVKPVAANSTKKTSPAKQAKDLATEAPAHAKANQLKAASQKASAAHKGRAGPMPAAALARRPGVKGAHRADAQTPGAAQRPGKQVTRGIASKAGEPMERGAPAHAKAKFLTNPLAPRFLKAAPAVAAPRAAKGKVARAGTKPHAPKNSHVHRRQRPSRAHPRPALARPGAGVAAQNKFAASGELEKTSLRRTPKALVERARAGEAGGHSGTLSRAAIATPKGRNAATVKRALPPRRRDVGV